MKRSLTNSAISVLFFLIVSKFLGFFREICLAYSFGTSYVTDVYSACIALPSILFALYASGYAESYMVSYAQLESKDQQKRHFNNVTTILTVFGCLIATVCFWGSSWLSSLLAPGFEPVAAELLSHFIRLIVITLPPMVIMNILAAHIQANEHFSFVAFCNYIVINLLIIISILIAARTSVDFLIFGYVISHFTATIFLAIYAARERMIAYTPSFHILHPDFLTLSKMAIPMGASLLVNQLNGMADRIFASLLGEGVISAFNYANKVQLIFYALTTSVFISVCYPRINQFFAERNTEGGMYYIRKAILSTAFVSLPIMGGLFLFSRPLVVLLFERGMFTAESTAMTAECLEFYALGIPFYALREIFTRTLAASLAQKRILKNTVLSVVCNILLNLILLRPLGHIGLALATSITGVISCLLMLYDLRTLGLSVFDCSQLSDVWKIAVSSGLSLGLCGICYQLLTNALGGSSAIIASAVLAALVYAGLSIVLRIEIFVWIYQRLPARVQIIPWLNR